VPVDNDVYERLGGDNREDQRSHRGAGGTAEQKEPSRGEIWQERSDHRTGDHVSAERGRRQTAFECGGPSGTAPKSPWLLTAEFALGDGVQ
jgi:hypothetical protein